MTATAFYRSTFPLLCTAFLTLTHPSLTLAETGRSTAILLEEVVVTARKHEESSQSVPLSIAAFNADQIEVLKIHALTDLAVNMPNVATDDIGTSKGTANFSIRGLGINSSIPSIDPTVGLFVDGVYMGVNNAILLDTFDLESIEVLRGPQGTLFGRNVTGGAVLLRTRLPTDTVESKIRTGIEGGGEDYLTYTTGSVSGPLSDTLRGKFVAHYSDDRGWFENLADGESFGALTNEMVRGLLDWDLADDLRWTLRYEYQEFNGDGPAAQSHTNGLGFDGANGNFDRDSFDFAIDEKGLFRARVNFAQSEFNWNVPFGDGTVTNITGWRNHTQDDLVDIDSSPVDIFKVYSRLQAEQFSNELRYFGTFADRWQVTTGLYYFTNSVDNREVRTMLTDFMAAVPAGFGGPYPPVQLRGGGAYKVDTKAIFSNVDYQLNDNWSLTGGLRYTHEKKSAEIVTICSTGCPADFRDHDNWDSLSFKIGATRNLTDTGLLYTHWSRGFRSGGYNLRHTSLAETPASFDEEQVDNYELGVKLQLSETLRVNGAIFYNKIQDMQREINLADSNAAVVQLVRNTADANIRGAEIEIQYAATSNLVLFTSAGYIDTGYTSVQYDLDGSCYLVSPVNCVNEADKSLKPPRAAPWTYSVGVNHDMLAGDWGSVSSRISYAYRDESFYTDDNRGYIENQTLLNAGIDFYSNDGHWQIALYGKNLLDSVKNGGDTQLPPTIDTDGDPFSVSGLDALPQPYLQNRLLGGTFAPLAKGRSYGVEVTYKF